MMDYQTALQYILGLTDYEQIPASRLAANFDLRRMEVLLARLGNPHLGRYTVHLAGTKGKGSTAAMVASVLRATGYRTGLFTSPHLLTYRERFRVNDRLISEAAVARLVTRLQPLVEEINARATYGRLTTFEVTTALACCHFQEEACHFQVLETGLGGRLDATNVVRPLVCIITSISLDHTAILGDTLGLIAREKAGIIKPGAVVVSAPQAPEAQGVIEEVCRENSVPLLLGGRDFHWQRLDFNAAGQRLIVRTPAASHEVWVSLLGGHQVENAAVAVAALEALVPMGVHIAEGALQDGLARVQWPGRLQVLEQQPWLVVDGAHNVDSARRLRRALAEYFPFHRAFFILGVSSDKDIAGIVAELTPLAHHVFVTRSGHPRAARAEAIAEECQGLGLTITIVGGVAEALTQARAMAGADDLICATGSLFLVADVLKHQLASAESVPTYQ